MSLNCNEINLILDELNLEGAFIQEIIQPGYDTLALYTYKEGTAKTVLICTAQNSVRLNETRRKITKNDKPLRFMEFLRAHIKGCRINSVTQLGFERVIKLELSRIVQEKQKNKDYVHISLIKKPTLSKEELEAQNGPEEFEENYILYIKLWNNAANVLICDVDNTILEPMFRRPERNEVKDEKFVVEVREQSAEEVAAKYPVREWNDQPNFNSYIDWWYSEHSSTLSRESLLEKAEKWYNSTRSKKESALHNLEAKLESFKNAAQLKHQGDLILSFGHLINSNSRYLECEDYETGKTVRLLIDPEQAVQKSCKWFRRTCSRY